MTAWSVEFEIVGLPRMSNASGRSRGFWAIRQETKKWKDAVTAIARSKRPPKPLVKAKVTLTRFSSVSPDYDGLVTGFKPVLDGLVAGGILENDKFANIGAPTYLWERAPGGKGKIRVRVEEVLEVSAA